MSYFLSDDQAMVRETVRRFAAQAVEPAANEIDRDDVIPDSVHRTAAEIGLFGLYTPEDHGGIGQNLTLACAAVEEIAKASPAYAGLISVQMILCPAAIAIAGTSEQKARWLEPSARGERLLAWSQSEPVGAANQAAHQTRLTADGNGYRLNGLKIYCSQGNAAAILVMARTARNGAHGYGCAVVDTAMAGVDPAPYEAKLGWRGTNTGTIAYNDVFVPPENIMGDLLTGNAAVWEANVVSCIGHSASSLGAAQGMFDKTLAFVKERNLYGAPMRNLQPVSYWLAEAHARIEAMRSQLYMTTMRWDAGQRDPLMSAICKGWICETAFDVTHRLLQLWGGAGIMDATGINRYFRDARTNMIAEGANEMHYAQIADVILENPMLRPERG